MGLALQQRGGRTAAAADQRYNKAAGFCVRFDYGSGLRDKAAIWTLAYTLIDDSRRLSKDNMVFSEAVQVDPLDSEAGIAIFPADASFHITDCAAQEKLCLVLVLYADEVGHIGCAMLGFDPRSF